MALEVNDSPETMLLDEMSQQDEDNAWWECMQHIRHRVPASDKTNFEHSMTLLNTRVELVRIGWQHLYADLRAGLSAVGSLNCATVVINGPVEVEGGLEFHTTSDDRVVRGILRKAEQRSRRTCMACGRPGHGREVGRICKTLCGACAGLHLLEHELGEMLQVLHTESGGCDAELVRLNALSPRVRILIDRSKWITMLSDVKEDCQIFVLKTELLALEPFFCKLLKRVCKITEQM